MYVLAQEKQSLGNGIIIEREAPPQRAFAQEQRGVSLF